MKHLCLSILLIFSALLATAQMRFAAPGAKWCTSTLYIFRTQTNDPLYAIDTIISNTTCSYINGLGCLYVKNDTVYNIRDNGIVEFMYDYNAQPGDLWLLYNLNYRANDSDSVIAVRIDSTKKVVFNGDTLRLIINHVDSLNGNPFNGYSLGNVLEGVGPTRDFFRPGPWGFYDSGLPVINCYSDSLHGAITEIHGPLEQTDSCSCRFSTAINELEEGQVSIVHSQSQHVVNISFLQNTKASITIYNVQGQQLSRDEVHASTHSINTTGYTTGVYLCTVIVEGYRPYTKKIVVQQ